MLEKEVNKVKKETPVNIEIKSFDFSGKAFKMITELIANVCDKDSSMIIIKAIERMIQNGSITVTTEKQFNEFKQKLVKLDKLEKETNVVEQSKLDKLEKEIKHMDQQLDNNY